MLGKSKPALTKASGHKAPISSHPIFPIVVAVWFAALLGLGSLVLPITIFERLFAITGISSLVSAAQAPLGTTARILIAVATAGTGAVAGLLIARKVIAAQNAPTGRNLFADKGAADEAPAKRPISAHEELGSDSFDDPVQVSAELEPEGEYRGKRRSLTVTDDSARSEFLDYAPLPGGEVAYDSSVGEEPEEPVTEPILETTVAEQYAEPLELNLASEQQLDEVVPVELADLAEDSTQTPDEFQSETPEYVVPAEDTTPHFTATAEHTDAEAELPYNPFENAPPINESEASPFTAPAVSTSPDTPANAKAPLGQPAPAEPAEDAGLVDKPLNELGMVELVERFAMALQSKSADEVAAITVPAKQDEPEEVGTPLVFRRSKSVVSTDEQPAATPTERVEDAPATASRPALPTAFQPLELADEDTEDHDADIPGLSLSFASIRHTETASAEESEEPQEEDVAEENGYDSLLNMKAPGEFVRVEDEGDAGDIEPVVVFPGHETAKPAAPEGDRTAAEPMKPRAFPTAAKPRPFDGPGSGTANSGAGEDRADSGETERALREALEKLQRMSGAA